MPAAALAREVRQRQRWRENLTSTCVKKFLYHCPHETLMAAFEVRTSVRIDVLVGGRATSSVAAGTFGRYANAALSSVRRPASGGAVGAVSGLVVAKQRLAILVAVLQAASIAVSLSALARAII